MSKPLFELGQVVATPRALAALEKAGESYEPYLDGHVHGNWGHLSEEDRNLNFEAIQYRDRIMSSFVLSTGVRIWIITDDGWEVTTLLLPSEY